ncbi:DEAD/DEAH box helicase family protein [Larkinella ripae]
MIVLKPYQEKAVSGLLENAFDILLNPGSRRQKMVFKAPTGSGKTLMMADFMRRLTLEFPQRALGYPRSQVAFVWLAPNQLHTQSFERFRAGFQIDQTLRPVEFDDVQQFLQPGDVLFLNWQSVNKEKNVYIRDNEHDRTLQQYIHRTIGEGTELIVVLDEAHLFANKGKRAQELLNVLQAKIEIDVSATAFFDSDNRTVVKRADVIKAEMIKKQVLLNPDLNAVEQVTFGVSLDEYLLTKALARRQELKASYQKLGVAVNPLLLIQLPNDTATMSSDDLIIRNEVTNWLGTQHGITTANGKLAVWLSDGKDKVNLEGIEAPDNLVEVLLFKQAIALGWDCPRAAVLLIYRKLNAQAFTIQTVGRILRMPHQKHYPIDLLNVGYVYTDLSRDVIQVVADDVDYIVQNRAIRRADYIDINLPSAYMESRLIRNRLGAKFRRCLEDVVENNWKWSIKGDDWQADNLRRMQQVLVEINVDNIEIPVPADVVLTGEIEVARAEHTERFAKTSEELRVLFRQFCHQNVGGYGPAESTPVLEGALLFVFEKYVGYSAGSGEVKAIKTILYPQNRPHFADVIEQVLARYEEVMQQEAKNKSKQVERYAWDVPVERAYNELYEAKTSESHVLHPFYQYKSASNPEIDFADFLAEQEPNLEWWYKNGEKTKADFAVPYQKADGTASLFYVDFVIQLKNGTIALFDTKTPGSDPDFCAKHNALIGYLETLGQERSKAYVGGVIVPVGVGDNRRWKYSPFRISSATDTTGWSAFFPKEYA